MKNGRELIDLLCSLHRVTDFDQALADFDQALTDFDQALADFDPSDVNYFMKYTMLPNFNNLVKIS